MQWLAKIRLLAKNNQCPEADQNRASGAAAVNEGTPNKRTLGMMAALAEAGGPASLAKTGASSAKKLARDVLEESSDSGRVRVVIRYGAEMAMPSVIAAEVIHRLVV
jgi:hypothetical protein